MCHPSKGCLGALKGPASDIQSLALFRMGFWLCIPIGGNSDNLRKATITIM